MSYTNGVGSTQLLLAAVSTTAASAASRAQGIDSTGNTGPAAAVQAGTSDDHTTLSTAGSLMAQPAGDSDVRMDKVAALQQAIAAGTYSIPAGDVADKLIGVLSNGAAGR